MSLFQILIYFLCEDCNPPWKKSPPLSHQPPSKSWGPVKSPLFENLVEGSTLAPTSRKGGGAHYGCDGKIMQWWNIMTRSAWQQPSLKTDQSYYILMILITVTMLYYPWYNIVDVQNNSWFWLDEWQTIQWFLSTGAFCHMKIKKP